VAVTLEIKDVKKQISTHDKAKSHSAAASISLIIFIKINSSMAIIVLDVR